jgi:hypothetical protein
MKVTSQMRSPTCVIHFLPLETDPPAVVTVIVVSWKGYPFGSAAATAAALRQSGLAAGELRDIDRNNILRVLPKLAR